MKKRQLISVVILILLLFNLSIGVFAGDDAGTARPKIKIIIGNENTNTP